MCADFPEVGPSTDVRALVLTYLDFYRATVADKLSGLSEDELRASRLPSGWTPIELLQHLIHMERRWIAWGIAGEHLAEPWGDERDGRWTVGPDTTVAALLADLRAVGRRTGEIVSARPVDAPASGDGRFAGDPVPPSVTAVLLHVFQEYARHAGHLDIARELIDGRTGE